MVSKSLLHDYVATTINRFRPSSARAAHLSRFRKRIAICYPSNDDPIAALPLNLRTDLAAPSRRHRFTITAKLSSQASSPLQLFLTDNTRRQLRIAPRRSYEPPEANFGPESRNFMKRVSPATKMRVLGAIEFAPGSTIIARIHHVSGLTFKDEEGKPHQFTWRTIQTWYSRYQKDGITTMHPRPRSDRGTARKVEPELLAEAIEQVRPFFRGPVNVASIYRACIEKNLLRREQVAPNTFRRHVARYELLKPESESENKARLAFSKAHANQLWQADTLIGPYISHGGKKVQAKLIAFIDDASRVCCHGQFFAYENTDTLLQAFRSALYKRGVPEALYVDNGSIYASKELGQVTARLGCLLCHTPVRDGAAKGKVERFFRTVRDKFLSRNLDLSGVDSLNRAFFRWIEDEYNSFEHSAIGMRPIDRFGLDLKRVRYLPPGEVSEELFFVEETRKVLADNTFSLQATRFEAPRDLRSKEIFVRFDRKNWNPESPRAVVFFKGERMGEARPVNFQANDRRSAIRPDSPSLSFLREGGDS